AAVEFNQTFTGTYAGDMSGSGSLTKTSSGTVTLTGSNSYQGGTFVNAGALIGDTESLQGSVAVSSGTLGFDQATSGTFSGALLGTSINSRFVKTGVGDLTLSATNTNDGAWTVSGGRLIGTTSSLQGAITNNAAVTFDQATSGTYAGTMSGSGSLTKAGAGAVTLSGTSSHSGATTVSAGSLLVNGTLANSAVTVGNGALLGGGGTIGSLVTALSGGTISPGNSPGLLTVGSLDLQAGSTTLMEIIGSGSGAGTAGIDYDKLVVTASGGLNYGGVLNINFGNLSDFASGTTFDLFGLNGTPTSSFASILATGSGSYASASFTFDGVDVWTSQTLANSQILTFTESTGALAITAVPEPSTWALAVIGAGAAGWMARRRRPGRGKAK
ncbi:MAG: autotransporter-associated beta strand repeat-containing protein, partial [Planctomycetia bacterium]